jgi:hypothetical protein
MKTQKPSTKKRRRATPQQAEAGRKNLLQFRAGRQPNLKHGVSALVATGEMPPLPEAAEIERAVGEIIAGFVQDLGGPEAVTNAQRVILSGLRLSLLVQGLAEVHLKRSGIVNRRTEKANSLLSVAATFINSARLGAVALGLERRARNVTTLAAKLQEIADREHAESGTGHEDTTQN